VLWAVWEEIEAGAHGRMAEQWLEEVSRVEPEAVP
jgi:hypothetical protein